MWRTCQRSGTLIRRWQRWRATNRLQIVLSVDWRNKGNLMQSTGINLLLSSITSTTRLRRLVPHLLDRCRWNELVWMNEFHFKLAGLEKLYLSKWRRQLPCGSWPMRLSLLHLHLLRSLFDGNRNRNKCLKFLLSWNESIFRAVQVVKCFIQSHSAAFYPVNASVSLPLNESIYQVERMRITLNCAHSPSFTKPICIILVGHTTEDQSTITWSDGKFSFVDFKMPN
jgi:hypothetical protein